MHVKEKACWKLNDADGTLSTDDKRSCIEFPDAIRAGLTGIKWSCGTLAPARLQAKVDTKLKWTFYYESTWQTKHCMKLPFTFLLLFLFIGPTFSQKSARANYDSLWYFHPFSIDLSAGLWMPAGKLATYYRPSAQLGASFGLMVSKKMRFQLWIMTRFLQQ